MADSPTPYGNSSYAGYRILDVKTYEEGYLQLRRWMVFAVLVILQGGLWMLWEIVLLNVEDIDTRDMLWDQRVTIGGIQEHHKYFRTAMWPAIMDTTNPTPPSEDLPVVELLYQPFGTGFLYVDIRCLATDASSRDSAAGPLNTGTDFGEWAISDSASLVRNSTFNGVVNELYFQYDDYTEWESALPESLSVFQSLVSQPAEGAESWDQTQWMDYASSNWDTLSEALCVRAFDLSEQAYSAFTAVEDESIDGRYVRTRYENEGLLQLRTWRDGGLKAEGVYLMDRQQGYISTDEIAAFILNVVSLYPADTEYTPPPEGSLSDSLTVDGTLVLMQTSETNDGDIKHFGWSGDLKDLWLWPLPCPETSTQQYFLQGSAVGLERPSYIEGESTLSMARVEVVGEYRELPWFVTKNDYDALTGVVEALESIEIRVSYSTLRQPCCMWRISDVETTYVEVWSGTLADSAGEIVPATQVNVAVALRDVSEPRLAYLPDITGYDRFFNGMLACCFGGGIFLAMPYFGFIIHRNVRENNNLPPPFYRQTLEYRGW
ncbi:hypothetical protein CYMTET_36107 [Cymbomonas tetramitiformis]|uniref:Uncharacterized protein n=1 Tax=Cymbomonas tetramitiformis TaxID=36881 RepID=A0AAE0CI41_9CHLO|nr:hypothetical protein CYMTET_36107 [Cymbomonas tetramitiformis]